MKIVTVRFPEATVMNVPKGTTVDIVSAGATLAGGTVMSVSDMEEPLVPPHQHNAVVAEATSVTIS